MKIYTTEKIRNIALIGSKGVGKTTLLDAIVYKSGLSNRFGKVDDKTSFVDFDPLEIKKLQTMIAKVIPCEWQNCKINFFDTPGYADFIGETIGNLGVCDVALVLVDAVNGVDVQTKRLFKYIKKMKKPYAFLINKMDRDRADFNKVLSSIKNVLSKKGVLIHLPMGSGSNFQGVIDLVEMKAIIYKDGKASKEDIPEEFKEEAQKQRTNLIETIAENDEKLLDEYLSTGKINPDEIRKGLIEDIAKGEIAPILIASAVNAVGIDSVLDDIVNYFPSPKDIGPKKVVNVSSGEDMELKPDPSESLSMLVFKTMSDPGVGDIFFFRLYSGKISHGQDVFNATKKSLERIGHLYVIKCKERDEVPEAYAGDIVAVAKLKNTGNNDTLCLKNKQVIIDPIKFPEPIISLAVRPKTKHDQDKLGMGLSKLMAADPTFLVKMDKEFGETVVYGMGETHIEVMVERLKEKFGIDITLDKPHIPYRETIQKTSSVQHKYKKQSGGRGQYGDVWLKIEPLKHGTGFEFVDAIKGGVIPSKYIPAVEKGVKEAMAKGIVAGYPVVDVKVTLYDGTYHTVDSSDMAFQIAGSMAFKKAQQDARPVILEPIIELDVTAPGQYLGDISNDISGRRGKVTGMEHEGEIGVIKALVPLAEMYKYSTNLRSITRGAGSHTISFSHYEKVPSHVSQKIIEEAKKEKEEKVEK